MRTGIDEGSDTIVGLAYHQHRHRGDFMRQVITRRRNLIFAPDTDPLLLENGLLLVLVNASEWLTPGGIGWAWSKSSAAALRSFSRTDASGAWLWGLRSMLPSII